MRGYLTSAGKSIKHGNLIASLLASIALPLKRLVKYAAHTSGKDFISQGNALADREAKRLVESGTTLYMMLEIVAQQQQEIMVNKMFDPLYIQKQMTHTELKEWAEGGCVQKEGVWVGPNRRIYLPNCLLQMDQIELPKVNKWHLLKEPIRANTQVWDSQASKQICKKLHYIIPPPAAGAAECRK